MLRSYETTSRKRVVLGIIVLISTIIITCSKENVKVINPQKTEEIKIEQPKGQSIRIAIGSMVTPKEEFAYYKKLLDYIEEKLKRPIKIVSKENYAEINKLMGLGDVDVAFINSKPYVDGYRDYKIQLLAVPKIKGQIVYYSYIIVPVNSPVKSLEELRGKTFAFVDPMSNDGKLYPHYILSKMGETPDFYFKKYIYTYAQDKSIKMIAKKIVDGAAVSSVIWEYYSYINPELTSKTRIIKKSPPFGMPPVVVRPDLKPELKKELKELFLNIHKDEKGKEILKEMMIDKFVHIDDSAYNSIREMKMWVND